MMYSPRRALLGAVCVLAGLLSSCGGSSTPSTVVTRSAIGAALSLSALTITPGGSMPPSVGISVTRPSGDTDSVNIAVSNLPSNVTAQITQPGMGNSGAVAFTVPSNAPPGSYQIGIQVADSVTTSNKSLTLTIPVLETISSSTDSSLGLNGDGQLNEFMSTSFQPASWTLGTFSTFEATKTSELKTLGSHHVRLQPVEYGTPEISPGVWDFSTLNALLDPVLSNSDYSPELQLARAPGYLYTGSKLLTSQFADYAQYAANMVRYYNTHAGFLDGNGVIRSHVADSPSTGFTPITYWGIYNEPNYNGVSASDYVTLYNMTVAAMQAAGSEVPIRFVALEMGDGLSSTQQAYFTAFARGVTAPVDVIATHYYATCNQADSDAQVFNQVTQTFVPELQFIQNTLKSNSALANLPIWITENNINADYDAGGGKSACNGGTFTPDQRGTDSYFAAWRPYVFSQVGKLGVQGLYQWVFDGDKQYGEIDNNGNKYLSYWVDYYLGQYYPFAEPDVMLTAGETILQTTSNEPSDAQTVETLATKRADGSYVIMVVDHAVVNSSDNNGAGAPRMIVLDVSALGSLPYADEIVLDANTDITNGPSAATITPAAQIIVNLTGYGTAFVTLSNKPISHATPIAVQPRAVSGVLTTDSGETEQ